MYSGSVFFSTPLTDPKQLPTQEFLKCSVQEIIADLNSKRKRDAALLEGKCFNSRVVKCVLYEPSLVYVTHAA